MKRREFVRSSMMASLAAMPFTQALAAGETLPPTPRDYEGPYYPVGDRNRTNDLIVGEPRQQTLMFRGRVVDVDGRPLARALVDIWQADSSGRYKHPRDQTAGERWDEFLYWGETSTGVDGSFEFRTYLPGDYGNRPAHIHFKVWRDRQRLLTSQMYFEQTGGARGASRNAAAAELQTVSLKDEGDDLSCYLQVVV